jgi:hypothetical protein
MVQIECSYRGLFAELAATFPQLKVLCYAYDYPRPLVGGGTYIGRHLRAKGIPDELMAPIMVSIVDRLNDAIEQSTQSTNVHFLNCRGVTEKYTWYDDMHPDRDGFLALAVKFEDAMSQE